MPYVFLAVFYHGGELFAGGLGVGDELFQGFLPGLLVVLAADDVGVQVFDLVRGDVGNDWHHAGGQIVQAFYV